LLIIKQTQSETNLNVLSVYDQYHWELKINILNETSHLLKKEDIKDNLEVLETNLLALNRIHPFKNSSMLVYQLEQKISLTKELISESRYLEALKLMKGNTYRNLHNANVILDQLNDYKDSIKLNRKVKCICA
jgi:hypothetical protein